MEAQQEQAYGLPYQAQQEGGTFYYPEQEQSNGPAFSGGGPEHRGWAYPDTGRSQDAPYRIGAASSYSLGSYEQGGPQEHASGQHEGRYQAVSTHAPPTSSPSGLLGAQDDPGSLSSSLFAPPSASDNPSSTSESNKSPSAGAADAFSAWSAADDEVLRVLMAATSGRSWPDIARRAFSDGRHGHKDCQQRWRVLGKTQTVKGNWSPEESARLERLVEKYGPEKWVVIATEMPGRSGKQCRERWHNHLDPSIDKTDITPEEGALIMQLYAELGPRWAEISKQLPGRPDNTCKNYYNTKTTQRRKVADRQERLDKRRMGQTSGPASKLPDIGLSLLPSPSSASTLGSFSPSAFASTSGRSSSQPWEPNAAQPSPSLLSPATSSTPTASSSATFESSVSRTPSRSPSFGQRNAPYPLPAPLALSNSGSGSPYLHSQPISRSVSGSSSSSSAGSGFRTPSSSRRLYFTPSLLNSPLAESPFPTSPSTPSSSTSGSSTAVLGGLAGLNILTPTGLAFPATMAANAPESGAMAPSSSRESGASASMRSSLSRSARAGGDLTGEHGQYYQQSTHGDIGPAITSVASSFSNRGSYASPSSYLSASPLISSHSASAGHSPSGLPGRSPYPSNIPQEYSFPMVNMAERTDLKLPPMPTAPSHDQVSSLSRSAGALTQPVWSGAASHPHEAIGMAVDPSPGPRLPPLDMSGQPQMHPANHQHTLSHSTSPTKGVYGRTAMPVTPPQTAGLASSFESGVSSSSFAVSESPLQFGGEQFVSYSSLEETPHSSTSFEWSYPSSSSSTTTAGPLSAPLSSTSSTTAHPYTWSSAAQQQSYPQYSHNLPLSGSASRHASGFSRSGTYVPPPPPPPVTGTMQSSLSLPRSAPLSAPLPNRGRPSFLSSIDDSASSANS